LYFIFKVIYFRVENAQIPSGYTHIAVGVSHSPTEIIVSQLNYTIGSLVPSSSPAQNELHRYIESNNNVIGGSFAVSNAFLKIKPSSSFGFNFDASKIKF